MPRRVRDSPAGTLALGAATVVLVLLVVYMALSVYGPALPPEAMTPAPPAAPAGKGGWPPGDPGPMWPYYLPACGGGWLSDREGSCRAH